MPPITIKPITIKPMTVPGAAPAAAAPAPAASPAPAAAPSGPMAVPAAGAAPAGIRPIVIAPKPAGGMALGSGSTEPTIRLKPVVPGAAPAAPAATAAPAAAPAPAPAAPGAVRPIVIAPPASLKKPNPAEAAQAAKGKTSRISLDEALSTTTSAGAQIAMGRLTTNLSAAAESASADQPTLRLKPAVAPAAGAAPAPSETPTIRKKTLVLKKDAASADAESDAAETDAADKPTLRLKPATGGPAAKPTLSLKGKSSEESKPVTSTNDGIEAPPPAFSNAALADFAKPEKVSAAFPVVAALALIATIGLCLLFMAEFSGPDLTLTRFSSWPTGPAFTCPGVPRVFIR